MSFYWFCSAVNLFNSMLYTITVTLWKVVQANLNLQPCSSACWTAQLLSASQYCVSVSHLYQLSKLGVLFPCKSLLQTWSTGCEVFGKTLSCWILTRTTTSWPTVIHVLLSLFLLLTVCRLLYHGISILICSSMLCTTSLGSTCVRILWKLRQQRGLKVDLAYVTGSLVEMKISKTRCIILYSAKNIRFVSW